MVEKSVSFRFTDDDKARLSALATFLEARDGRPCTMTEAMRTLMMLGMKTWGVEMPPPAKKTTKKGKK